MKPAMGWIAAFVGGVGAGIIIGAVVAAGWGSRDALRPDATPPPVVPTAIGSGVGGPAVASNPYGQFRFSDFALLDQDGRATGADVLEGRVTVVAFFFSNCVGPCPAIAMVMADLQSRTAGEGLGLMSISVDGQRDDPAALRAYATRVGADPARWRFLTGDPAEVGRLASESLGYEVRKDAAVTLTTADGRAMANILHPTRLLLIGPDRRAIGVYPFEDPAAIDRLVADARTALASVAER